MSVDVYGYKIGGSVIFCLSPPHLINTLTGKSVRLRDTMSELLRYLIENAYMCKVNDSMIMQEVFELRGLRCSRQRLWQAINSLETIISSIGIGQRLTSRADGNGYVILNITISALYYFVEGEALNNHEYSE